MKVNYKIVAGLLLFGWVRDTVVYYRNKKAYQELLEENKDLVNLANIYIDLARRNQVPLNEFERIIVHDIHSRR